MASFVSFSYADGNTDCSWYNTCDFEHLCEDCSKCGIGCPKYYPYTSEVLKDTAAVQVEETLPRERTLPDGERIGAAPMSGKGARAGMQGGRSASLKLLPGETEITLRVFTDRTLVEAYWMDGRVAMTSATKPEMAKSGLDQVSVFSSVENEIASASAWAMESIWVTTEQVLSTPRVDGRK